MHIFHPYLCFQSPWQHAIQFLFERLYPNDLGLVEKMEQRKQLLHRQNHLGKRLTRLSGYFGLGFILLASQEAMGRM
jgi:hypothetical protein